jgi:DNA-binding CsgD family transcriptional regulator
VYTIPIFDELTCPSVTLPSAWAALSAEIVECLEETSLPELLSRSLHTLLTFEHCALFVYQRNASPIHIYDTYWSSCAKLGLNNYVRNTYVLDPFYRRFMTGVATGVYRLPDLAPSSVQEIKNINELNVTITPSEEIGYLTDGWPPGRQELCIALELPLGECASLILERQAGDARFSAADIALLKLVIPFLAASFRRFWRRARFTSVSTSSTIIPGATSQLLGRASLTPREREVAQLLLCGHSTPSVSLLLSISPTTVKTHRKNLYAKLGIATQCELFSLFSNSLPDIHDGRASARSGGWRHGELSSHNSNTRIQDAV